MIENKFRGWVSTDDGIEMIYFGQSELDNGLWFDSPKHIEEYLAPLMRYTGLKDKNGKEIYEGDIIDIHQTVNGCRYFTIINCVGGYNVQYFIAGDYSRPYEYDIQELLDVNTSDKEIEVVGHIYEKSL